jgi:3-deoxy-D-manno-octulosonic-acid transferase
MHARNSARSDYTGGQNVYLLTVRDEKRSYFIYKDLNAMHCFWILLYNIIAVPLMWIVFYVLSIRSNKIRQGIRGRRRLFHELEKKLETFEKRKLRFWIHNSSMGEYEQARPIISALKKHFPECLILVTFFSPSGKEHIDKTLDAELISYLPFDTYRQAKRFVNRIHPSMALVIRHEFWPNHLYRLKQEKIPAILVNASIRQPLFLKNPLVLSFQRFLFDSFQSILSVSQDTVDLIHKYNLSSGSVSVSGDTRYDQVMHRARKAEQDVAPLNRYRGKRRCLVAGSTWPSDDAVLIPALARLHQNGLLPWIILVPHEPTEIHLSQAENLLTDHHVSFCRFSRIENFRDSTFDVLLVDRIGILASLYVLADLAFVGGGFGQGVHQVLEPAAFGVPVIYGPKSVNSYEADQLKRRGVGFIVKDEETLYQLLSDFLQHPETMQKIGENAASLVRENVGATQRILSCIEQKLSS